MADSQYTDFNDELDALIDKWLDKELDDRLEYGMFIASLTFKAHNLMANCRESYQESGEEEPTP